MNAASGGHHEWKRIMFRPCAFAMRTMRRQESTSVGGWPVFGKIAHSRVPRKKALRPFTTNCVPCVADLPQAEADRARVAGLARLERGGEPVEHGRELVPRRARSRRAATSTSNVPPEASHETSDAFGATAAPSPAETASRNVPRPALPVAFPILPRTTADRDATRG